MVVILGVVHKYAHISLFWFYLNRGHFQILLTSIFKTPKAKCWMLAY